MEDKKELNSEELEQVNGGVRWDWQTEELEIAFREAGEYFAYKAGDSELRLPDRVSERYSRMAELCLTLKTDDESILNTLEALRNIVNGEMSFPPAKRELADLEEKIHRILR